MDLPDALDVLDAMMVIESSDIIPKDMLNPVNEYAAYKQTGLTPQQVAELLETVKTVCNACGWKDGECKEKFDWDKWENGEDDNSACIFAKWKEFAVKDDD